MFAAIFLSFVHASIDPLSNSALLNGGIAASLAPTAATSQLVPEPAAARAGAAVAATAPVEESVGGGVIPMGGEIVHIKETFNTTADLLAIKHHKGIMPLETWDYVGVVLALVGAAFANAGGAGGGGIFVPMLILVMGFNAHEAIPLSKVRPPLRMITLLRLPHLIPPPPPPLLLLSLGHDFWRCHHVPRPHHHKAPPQREPTAD